MKIDPYCQRQRCKHVELDQFLVCFYVARVCQRQLGILVLIRHEISELRRPIATKLCHVITDQYMCQLYNASPEIRSLPLKIFTLDKIWVDFTQLPTLIANIFNIRKICDRERFLPHSAKQVRWTLVHYPESRTCEFGLTQVDFFVRQYFVP